VVWVAICPRCREPFLTMAERKAHCPICHTRISRFRHAIELPADVRWSGANR
jgi:rubrerythrin